MTKAIPIVLFCLLAAVALSALDKAASGSQAAPPAPAPLLPKGAPNGTVELDRNADGVFEMQVLMQEGRLRRVKLNVVGDDHYDIYETYELLPDSQDSQLISIGYDLQGDGAMDRLLTSAGEETEAAPPTPAPAPGEE